MSKDMPREVSFEEDVIDRLARIETTIAALTDLETRVRAVEKSRWFLAGIGALVGALFGHVPFITH